MDIHTKINYRSWIINHWLLNYHSFEKIEWLKKQLFSEDHLKEFAKISLSYNNKTKGKSSYFKSALYDSLEMVLRKKWGINYKGERIGFGENINLIKL